jgi:hypothetical protein
MEPNETVTIAYSYLRFSSPAQAEGQSVRRQTDLRDAWLKRHPAVKLDETLKADEGVSGYTGDNRKNPKHALAQFLDLVGRGRVPAGSDLIVENLDRLTREKPAVAIPAVLNLIAAGVRVVQLSPLEIVYDADMEEYKLMNMLWELARGHGESKRKSSLLAPVWAEKKDLARGSKIPHGAMCPAWLEVVGVKLKREGNSTRKDFSEASYRIKEDAARAVRRVFELCAAGAGSNGILERLVAEGIPPIGRKGKAWHRSYIQKLLDSRTVLGEYQPMKGSRVRVPEGDPVPGYYPAVIDEALWARAQQARADRRRVRPGPAAGFTAPASPNPFSGLVYDALDGAVMQVIGPPDRKYLCSAASIQKAGGWRTFPLPIFLKAMFDQLKEIKASDLFSDPAADKITVLNGRLNEVERKLEVAKAKWDADPKSPTWQELVDKHDREKRSLLAELHQARLEAANPKSAAWGEAVALMEMAEQEPARLRAALRSTIDGIWMVTHSAGKLWYAEALVIFAGDKTDRSYRSIMIIYRQRTAFRPGRWFANSLSQPKGGRPGYSPWYDPTGEEPEPGQAIMPEPMWGTALDLRIREQAEDVLKGYVAYDVGEAEELLRRWGHPVDE